MTFHPFLLHTLSLKFFTYLHIHRVCIIVYSKGKRTKVCDIYNDAEDQYMCMERAAILLERLDAKSPKFAKCMLPSNVLYSFWLVRIKKHIYKYVNLFY